MSRLLLLHVSRLNPGACCSHVLPVGNQWKTRHLGDNNEVLSDVTMTSVTAGVDGHTICEKCLGINRLFLQSIIRWPLSFSMSDCRAVIGYTADEEGQYDTHSLRSLIVDLERGEILHNLQSQKSC